MFFLLQSIQFAQNGGPAAARCCLFFRCLIPTLRPVAAGRSSGRGGGAGRRHEKFRGLLHIKLCKYLLYTCTSSSGGRGKERGKERDSFAAATATDSGGSSRSLAPPSRVELFPSKSQSKDTHTHTQMGGRKVEIMHGRSNGATLRCSNINQPLK